MKGLKLMIVVFLVLLFSTSENYAQEINGIPAGPIPKLKNTKNISSENSGFNSASIAFGYSSQQEASLSMPIPSGNPLTILSPHTFTGFASSMCVGGDGKYYLIESYFMPPVPDPSLYEFNPINDPNLSRNSWSPLIFSLFRYSNWNISTPIFLPIGFNVIRKVSNNSELKKLGLSLK